MFLDTIRVEVSQGDIFPRIELVDSDASDPERREPRSARVMVLSHDCEYDKLAVGKPAEHVLVVEIRSPEEAPHGLWGLIKAGRVWNALHIPEGENHGAGFLDFRRIYRIRKDTIEGAKEERVASLTDEGRRVAVYGLTAFLLHLEFSPDDDQPREGER